MNLNQFILTVFVNLLKNSREIRCVPFIRGSAFGYLAALAIPVDIPNRNIFFAFNFEANYALPWNDTHKDFINKWEPNVVNNNDKHEINPINLRKKKSLYTRNNFYKGILGYIERYENKSLACLQRFICETAESSLHKNNGILGSLIKVFFMPSTSKFENSILDIYYEAEEAGIRGTCYMFSKLCSTSFLDILTIT